jgi:hypothetical protein
MPDELAVPAGHHPAAWFDDPLTAAGTGRRCAALVDQLHPDPGQGGLVVQDLQGAADLPLPHPQVVPPAGVDVEDPAGVADGQRADPLVDGPADHRLRGLV